MPEKELTGEMGQGVAERVQSGSAERPGARFERRQADIVAAAIPILNELGFKGMRLSAVAEAIGLRSTSVTYYFPRKDELTVACMETGFDVFHELLDVAEAEPDARSRLSKLVELFVQRDAQVRRGEAIHLASFASLRALEGEHFKRALDGYLKMFRRVRVLFGELPPRGPELTAQSIRTLILLEQLYWAHDWLAYCDLDDYPRAAARMTDIMLNGFAMPGSPFEPEQLNLTTAIPGVDPAKEAFLRAATRQINAHGYVGASVDRISASLNVTKGAFYHHNDAKDDVVAACFRRTFGVMGSVRRLIRDRGDSEWRRMSSGVGTLVNFQCGEDGPMLHTGVLYSLPQEQRKEIVASYHRVEWTIAGMISDAVAEGAVRPIDVGIASRFLLGAINAAADMRHWPEVDLTDASRFYCRATLLGLLTPYR